MIKKWEKETKRICKFIKDYVEKSKTKGVVIGMSGGIDSAVVAALSIRALGKDKVHLIYLPRFIAMTEDKNESDIRQFCKEFDISFNANAIGGTERECKGTISYLVNYKELDKVASGNIQARLRMVYLYAIANTLNCMVLGTTNKSEWMIGYFTKYGDGACDVEPISHLYKTEIFELARYLEIPEVIINKAPSADLWEGQTDEGEIGLTYKKLDKILQFLENCEYSPTLLRKAEYKDFTKAEVESVMDKILKSDHKRRLPVSLER